MEHLRVARVLGDIARTASETLELREIFTRVAASARELIPLDDMGICRILDDGTATSHASTTAEVCTVDSDRESVPLAGWSERIRPRPGPIPRVSDAVLELDPGFPLDAKIIARGGRSSMWEPFPPGGRFRGGVWVCSRTPGAFTEEHQTLFAAIAALLGSVLEHWQLWDADMARQRRLDELEKVLEALAGSLDVRRTFESVSQALRPVLAHSVLGLTEHGVENRSIRVVAVAGRLDIEIPEGPVPLTDEEHRRRGLEHEIIEDIRAQRTPDTAMSRLLHSSGMLSMLRVPVRLSGEVRGSLVFLHRDRAVYGTTDIEVARRVADRIALALSYDRLAQEARLAAEACEKAQRLEARVETLTNQLEAQGRPRVIGKSRSWKEVLVQAARVTASDTTVLLTGESGTGKEVIARIVHQGSDRCSNPFVGVNCAALPEQLLESELFGHEKGAFTGAISTKIGRLEQAAGGTLFLDEVAEMSPFVQAKFLRVLEEREFQRVGGTRAMKADVRVIAATNSDLRALIRRGAFREDLYYRLNVFEIYIPPLRDRPEDILPLADNFLAELSRSIGRPAAGISRDAKEWLLAHAWPGNVRELRNAIERAILLCDGGLITREHLPGVVGRPAAARKDAVDGPLDLGAPLPSGGIDLKSVNRALIEKALSEARGNKSRAARLLGLTRSQFYTRLERYGLG